MGFVLHDKTADDPYSHPHVISSFVQLPILQDDTWGPDAGPCLSPWKCCGSSYNATTCNATNRKACQPACAAHADTSTVMGGIHPRSKKPVGDRLGTAAFNTVYGGNDAYTGPTLSGCASKDNTLQIKFNTTLLAKDKLHLNKAYPYVRIGMQLWGTVPRPACRFQLLPHFPFSPSSTHISMPFFILHPGTIARAARGRGWRDLSVRADQRKPLLHGARSSSQLKRAAHPKHGRVPQVGRR